MDWIKNLEFFAYGFLLGYCWYPFWEIVKKIVNEAKKAKKEWRQPNEH